MWKLKIKNGRKTPKSTAGGAIPQNSLSAGGDPLENPSAKEHAECDFALYIDILPSVSSYRKTASNTILDDLSIRTPESGQHHHQLLGSLNEAGGAAGFYREEENRAATKVQLEKPWPATARMLSDFLQHQRINPIPNPAPTSSRSNMPIGTRSWTAVERERWRSIRGTRMKL